MRKSFTSSKTSDIFCPQNLVRVGGITEAVPQEVERQNNDDNGERRKQEPGRFFDHSDLLRILQHDSPTDGWWSEANAEEAERCLRQNGSRQRQCERRNDVA